MANNGNSKFEGILKGSRSRGFKKVEKDNKGNSKFEGIF